MISSANSADSREEPLTESNGYHSTEPSPMQGVETHHGHVRVPECTALQRAMAVVVMNPKSDSAGAAYRAASNDHRQAIWPR